MMSYCDLQRWMLGGCTLLGLAVSSSAPGAIIAHYKFDEPVGSSTVVNEVTDNGGNGVVGASVVLGVAGVDGTAVQLPRINSDAGMINMGAAGNAADILNKITASGQVTISYWLKSAAGVNTSPRSVAVSIGSNANNNSYVDSGVRGDTGFVGAVYGRNRANQSTAPNIGDMAGPVVTNDQFHHIALTVDTLADVGTLYVDGAMVNTETSAAKYGAFPGFNGFLVGRLYRSSNADPFGGVIDDLQLYDQALTAREVQWLFANPGQAVPEPAGVVLIAVGLAVVACRRKVAS
ncbi:LamG-like jellyroll fold domain-containing protein [Aeoliella sp. SH292]|uniref:LamG-like jellyroll fold domain-containing protein n=1 Tax=Aeoliella sp. SH292 TaxID=3454464 RepID=UPI003F988D30